MSENPYDTPRSTHEEALIPWKSPLPIGYWMGLLSVGVLAVAALILLPPLGILGIGATLFAAVRSVAFVWRLQKGRMVSTAERLSADLVPFFMTSLAMGLAASLASAVAFVALCVPLGIGILSVSGFQSNDQGMIYLFFSMVAFSGLVGLFAGWNILRLSLPKIPFGRETDEIPSKETHPLATSEMGSDRFADPRVPQVERTTDDNP